jgi:hypothetical protein
MPIIRRAALVAALGSPGAIPASFPYLSFTDWSPPAVTLADFSTFTG